MLKVVTRALTQGSNPTVGLVVAISTVITGTWILVWDRRFQKVIKVMRADVRLLQQERDVAEAMHRIRHLQVVGDDSRRGDSHG